MFLLYSLLLSIAFVLMSPLFLWRREKYAQGFKQRLGNYPTFLHDGRKIIWLHCVSVGETNAARPLVDQLNINFPDHRLIVSTTTKTGQELAQKIFADKADAVFYFPFDWKFSVRKALKHFDPQIVLLVETEIWFNFFNESKKNGVKLAIVNGRLSERSANRYSYLKGFISGVLNCLDLALMQSDTDAKRILSLGINANKVSITGNFKFDHSIERSENELTEEFRTRFGISSERPFMIAASTHEPEEEWLLKAFEGLNDFRVRLLIAPRHPERFDAVAQLVESSQYSFVRRSEKYSTNDKTADIILLDSIGELRSIYPIAEIVFVGGSMIPHGGQSILEPAAAGKAIVTGHFTANFKAVVDEFLANKALLRLPRSSSDHQNILHLHETFKVLLEAEEKRRHLGENALLVMRSNRGATAKTIEALKNIL